MALLLTVSIHSLLQIPLIKGGKNKEPGKILLILFSLTFSIRSLFPQNPNQMARMAGYYGNMQWHIQHGALLMVCSSIKTMCQTDENSVSGH